MKKYYFILWALFMASGCSGVGGSSSSTPESQSEVLNPTSAAVSTDVASAVTGYWVSDDAAAQQAVLYFDGSHVYAYDHSGGSYTLARSGDYQLLSYTATNCPDCALVSVPCPDGNRGSLLYFTNAERTSMGFATNTAEGFYLGGTMIHAPSSSFTFAGETVDSVTAQGIVLP